MTDAWLFTVLEYGLRLGFGVAILLRRGLSPPVRFTWMMLLWIMPVITVPLYLMFGGVWAGTRLRKRYHSLVTAIDRVQDARERAAAIPQPELGERAERLAWFAERAGGNPPRAGNRFRLCSASSEFVDALVEDVDRARDHVHLLFYIVLTDGTGQRLADALLRARERGVACRLLADAVGSRDFLGSSLCAELRRAGVEVRAALQTNLLRMAVTRADLRNHRKIAVVDGTVGYTGSQNVADAAFAPKRRYAPWVDVMVRMEGPAVFDLQELFVRDWCLGDEHTDPQALMIGPPPPVKGGSAAQVAGTGPLTRVRGAQDLVHAAILQAREELVITTPYFVPDEASLVALLHSAASGVDLRLVVPRRNDSRLVGAASRSIYGPLLEAGARIWEYEGGLLHAKTMTMDRERSVVTTANFDRRSLELNFEVSLVVYEEEFSLSLREVQQGYMEYAREIVWERWRERSALRRLGENAAGLVTPLL